MRNRYKILCLILVVIGLTGCSKFKSLFNDDNDDDFVFDSVLKSVDVMDAHYIDISDACRPGAGEPITAEAWTKANNAFGYKFLKTTSGNTVFSPYSIERAIGMALDGACLSTADEMLKVLEMPNAKRLSMSGLAVEKVLKNVNNQTQLDIKNDISIEESVTLPSDYIARLKAGYNIDLSRFDRTLQPTNNNTEHSTNNKVKVVLSNSVYFKSEWDEKFEVSETNKQTFYGATGENNVDMMHITEETGLYSCDGYDVYEKSFNSSLTSFEGNYGFRIILPKVVDVTSSENRMEALSLTESKLSSDFENCKYKFENCECEYENVEANLSLPKFKLDIDKHSIKELMQSLGMTEAFTNAAKFYAMPNETPLPNDPSRFLKILDIIHKAFVIIDEEGGEAYAKTHVSMGLEEKAFVGFPEINFTVDHPFIFTIFEKSTGANLFVGRVVDL